jgi:GAF domain-containing protein
MGNLIRNTSDQEVIFSNQIMLAMQQIAGAAYSDDVLAALREHLLSFTDHISLIYLGEGTNLRSAVVLGVWDRGNFGLKAGFPDAVQQIVQEQTVVLSGASSANTAQEPVRQYMQDALHANSMIILPLKAGDRLNGYLVVARRDPGGFEERVVQQLLTVSWPLAMAIDRFALNGALTREYSNTRLFSELTGGLTGLLDLQMLGEATSRILSDRVPFSHMSFMLVQADLQHLRAITLIGQKIPESIEWAGTLLEHAISEDTAFVDETPGEVRTWGLRDVVSLGAIPLKQNDDLVGLLVVGVGEGVSLTGSDLALAGQIGSILTGVVSNVQMIENLQNMLQETSTLYSTSLALNAAQTIEEVYATALGETNHLANADRISLYLGGPDAREQLEYVEMVAIWEDNALHIQPRPLRFALEKVPILSQFPQSRSNMIFNNIKDDSRIPIELRANYTASSINAVMMLPLSTGATWLGALLVEAKRGQNFENSHARICRSLADQAALAIDLQLLMLQTRQAISRERALRQITDRIRSTEVVSEVMEIASEELSRALNLPISELTGLNLSESTLYSLSRADREFIESITIQVALATQNLNLRQAEREAASRDQVLRSMATLLTSSLDLDAVLNLLISNIGRVFSYNAAEILFIEGDMARIAATQRNIDDSVASSELLQMRFPIEQFSHLSRMVTSRTPLLIEDVRQDSTWPESGYYRWVQSYLGTPIVAGEVVLGLINLYSATAGAYDTEDTETLQTFANQAAIALRNAQLYDAARRQAELVDGIASELQHAAGMSEVMEATVRTLSTTLKDYDVRLQLTPSSPKQEE